MKIEEKMSRSTAVPPVQKLLIDQLMGLSEEELKSNLEKVTFWQFGKCDLHDWVDVLNLFDTILEQGCRKVSDSTCWVLSCDLKSNKSLEQLVLQVLGFTQKLLQHSKSGCNLYSSVDHLISLLMSSNWNVLWWVLKTLSLLSSQRDFLLTFEQQQSLISTCSYFAERWGGKETAFSLEGHCSTPSSSYPPSASTLDFKFSPPGLPSSDKMELEVESGSRQTTADAVTDSPLPLAEEVTERIVTITEDVAIVNTSTAHFVKELIDKFKVPVADQERLYTQLRVAHSFAANSTRLLCVKSRLEALLVLVNLRTLLVPHDKERSDLLEDLVGVLRVQSFQECPVNLRENMRDITDVKVAALRLLTAITSANFSESTGFQLSEIIRATGIRESKSPLQKLVHNYISASREQGTSFPLLLSKPMFEFLEELSSSNLGGKALIDGSMVKMLFDVVSSRKTQINIAATCFKIIEKLNMEPALFRSLKGHSIMPERLAAVLISCKKHLNTDICVPDSGPTIIPVTAQSNTVGQQQKSLDDDVKELEVLHCQPLNALLVQTMLNLLKRFYQDTPFYDCIRDDTLPDSLKFIVSNVNYFGSPLACMAKSILRIIIDCGRETLESDDNYQLDGEGRVVVNVDHLPNEPDIFLPPHLARLVKPHQVSGIRFLYENVVESSEHYKISSGSGCILAHAIGLGKTFQVCAFSEIFLRHTQAKTILIIVPVNAIQNWQAEFNLWLPAKPGPDEAQLDPSIQPRSFELYVLNESTKNLESRLGVISDWSHQGGVLLVSYEMFRSFHSQRAKIKRSVPKKEGCVQLEQEENEQIFLERVYQALVNPGPDLVICDEGHRIKNLKASISVALKEIRTQRRVVLTGYPLQNNLLEYWCMVDFVKPNTLGTRVQFRNLFELPIQNGQFVDSSPSDVKLMMERAYVLHSLLKGFVQRRSLAVLRDNLLRKEEYVLMLRFSPLQRALYRNAIAALLQNKSFCNPLKAFAVCLKIWNHPDVLYNVLQKNQGDVDLDFMLDDDATEKKTQENAINVSLSTSASNSTPCVASIQPPGLISELSNLTINETRNVDLPLAVPATLPVGDQGSSSKENKEEFFTSLDWATELFKEYVPGRIENAAKTQVFFTILEEAVRLGDRLLVFSQSLFTLDLLETFLKQQIIPGRKNKKWKKNRSYFRFDGSTDGMEREKLVNEFNSNPNVKLFLLSTRAGSLGINLIGANRVIVFDSLWNPSHDAQAVGRVYRYGQEKECYIYRFVTDNSLENKIFQRQTGKKNIADRVVDQLNPEVQLTMKELTTLVCVEEDDPPPTDCGKSKHSEDFSLTDPVLGKVIELWGSSLTKDPFQHNTLSDESNEIKLTEVEKRRALLGYEEDKKNGTKRRRTNSLGSAARIPARPIPSSQSPRHAINHNPVQDDGSHKLAQALLLDQLVFSEMTLDEDLPVVMNEKQIVLSKGTWVKFTRTSDAECYIQTEEGVKKNEYIRFPLSTSPPLSSPESSLDPSATHKAILL